MSDRSISSAILVLVGCVLIIGCKTLRDKEDGGFLKPLDSVTSPLSPVLGGKALSEREICVETARTVAEKGHATEAIKLYEKAERSDPSGPPLDLELAPLYAHVGNTESAIQRYRSAIAGGRTEADVFNNLAWTLMESGRHPEALQTIQQGLDVTPKSKRLQATHAVILYRSGDRDGSYEKFRELYGPSAAHHNLAVLDVDSGEFESAVEHAKVAAEFPGRSAESAKLQDAIQSQLASTKSDKVLR